MGNRIKVIDKLEIRPKGEYILVKLDSEEEFVPAKGCRIIVPEAALQNKKTVTGVIVGVGEGWRDRNHPIVNGDVIRYSRVPIDCEVGDRVVFAAYIGYTMTIGGVDHAMIKYNDCMADVYEESHYEEI